MLKDISLVVVGLVVLVVLAFGVAIYQKLNDGWPFSGRGGPGIGGGGGTSAPTELVIEITGAKYLIQDQPKSLPDVISQAKVASGTKAIVLHQSGKAMFLTVDKLKKELESAGIRYQLLEDSK